MNFDGGRHVREMLNEDLRYAYKWGLLPEQKLSLTKSNILLRNCDFKIKPLGLAFYTLFNRIFCLHSKAIDQIFVIVILLFIFIVKM